MAIKTEEMLLNVSVFTRHNDIIKHTFFQ